MLFHAARLESRLDPEGSVLLLEEQDRGLWDRRLIGRAQEFLARSAEGTVISAFHLEAAIACHHCTARSLAETDWPAILGLYDALIRLHRSPVSMLNRAIVVARIEGAQAGIRLLEEGGRDPALRHYHLFDATLGELYRWAGDGEAARRYFEAARRGATSPSDRAVINRRLAQCE
jgi:RNA polymerase sigma-70 factor (ECF subfamily)